MPWIRVLPLLSIAGDYEEEISGNTFNITSQRLTLRQGGLATLVIPRYNNQGRWFVTIERNGRFSRYHWSLNDDNLYICKFLPDQSTLNAAVDTSTMPDASDPSNGGCNASPWIQLIPPGPSLPPGPPVIKAVHASDMGAGTRHTCMIRSDRTMGCWGTNEDRKLGDGTTMNRVDPVRVVTDQSGNPPLTDVISVHIPRVLSGFYSCAIAGENKTLYCWGSRGDTHVPLLGINPPTLDHATASSAPYDKGVLQMEGGVTNFACILLESGRVDCWGHFIGSSNPAYNAQLGTPPIPGGATGNGQRTENICGTPATACNTVVAEGAKAIAAGHSHVCMIIDSGRARNKIQCWGRNNKLQAVRNSGEAYAYDPNHYIKFMDGTDITNAVAITAGDDHTCAIVNRDSNEGAVYCWGSNDSLASGLLTNGNHTHQANPIRFRNSDVSGAPFNIPNNTAITGAVFLSSGRDHNCAIVTTNDGNHLFCWGDNASSGGTSFLGRRATGSNSVGTSSARAVLVIEQGRDLNGTAVGGARPTSVVTGAAHTCVRYGAMENSFKCFGNGGSGHTGYTRGRGSSNDPTQ